MREQQIQPLERPCEGSAAILWFCSPCIPVRTAMPSPPVIRWALHLSLRPGSMGWPVWHNLEDGMASHQPPDNGEAIADRTAEDFMALVEWRRIYPAAVGSAVDEARPRVRR